jgi:DNA topoisomerase-2
MGDFEKWNIFKHIKEKAMWLGDKSPCKNDVITIKSTEEGMLDVKNEKLYCSPALCHCFVELIVNAIDQNNKYPEVDKIKIDYKNGIFTIHNNGKGFSVKKYEGKFIPELCFAETFAGTNLSTKKNISGGTNGLGNKLVVILSEYVTLETVGKDDAGNLKKYSQKFIFNDEENKERIIASDQSILSTDSDEYTLIKFKPNFKNIGEHDLKVYETIVETYAYYAAIWLGSKCKVYYKGNKIKTLEKNPLLWYTLSINKSVKVFNQEVTIHEYPWNINIMIAEDLKCKRFSLVNGTFVKDGEHFGLIYTTCMNIIKERIKEKKKEITTLKLKPSKFDDLLFIAIRAVIPDPGWESQTKKYLTIKSDKDEVITFSKKFIERLTDYLVEFVDDYIDLELSEIKPTKKRNNKFKAPEYDPAKFAGSRKRDECALYLCEGKSAHTFISNGLQYIGNEYNGIYALRGVPINAREEITEKIIGGKKIFIPSERFKKNEVIQGFLQVMNLQIGCDYKKKEDIATLNYGKIIVASDQDLDGFYINSSILNTIEILFAGLLENQMVYRLNTPLIIAFPKKKKDSIKEFLSDTDFKNWEDKSDISKYDIKYYKGLSTHDDLTTKRIFDPLDKSLINFAYDKPSIRLFKEYFASEEVKARKRILLTPFIPITAEEIKSGIVKCSSFLNDGLKAFQLDNLSRKLINIVDGLKHASRKIVYVLDSYFGQGNHQKKVYQLCGHVCDTMQYEHGPDSLNKTIIKLAATYKGSNIYPLITPHSNFGTRREGGKDAGAPRYIFCNANRKLLHALFPKEDFPDLQYNICEGHVVEPQYFIPVLPYAILNSTKVVAHGWQAKIYARTLKSVYQKTKEMILTKKSDIKLEFEQFPFDKCKMLFVKDKGLYMIANYKIVNETTIQIEELPIWVWSKPFVEELNENKYVKKVDYRIPKNNVDIKVTLFDTIAKINKDDPKKGKFISTLEKKLHLYKHIESNLNFMNIDGSVKECGTYEEAFIIHFNIRKKQYEIRYKRLKKVYEIKIDYNENLVKAFKTVLPKIDIHSITEEEMSEKLSETGVKKFNNGLYLQIEHLSYDELKDVYDKASHDYITHLHITTLSKGNYKTFQDKVDEYQKELERINSLLEEKPVAKTVWLEEIKECYDVMNECRKELDF